VKVSIITPTWGRHDLLRERCMVSVAAQTIPVEHVIVSDGPDPQLRQMLAGQPVTYAEVDVHHDNPNTCSWALNLGIGIASGEYVGECDDDNALRPEHAAVLAAALDANPEADFAYAQILRHGIGDVVGSDPPFHGAIDGNAIVYRRQTPAKFGWWWPTTGSSPDWHLVAGWIERGAKWVSIPQVTVDFYYWPGTWGWRLAHGLA
jgi:glycosyltransferase involved in cell wall biosynthesis